MQSEESRKRRRYSSELKSQILDQCDVPGASVAKVAMSHGVNANIVHGWRKLARRADPSFAQQEFVPIAVAASGHGPAADQPIEVELRRGAITVKLLWPIAHASQLSAFARELLR
jgi:transposase